jgi:hypothetical protein
VSRSATAFSNAQLVTVNNDFRYQRMRRANTRTTKQATAGNSHSTLEETTRDEHCIYMQVWKELDLPALGYYVAYR